MKNRYEDMGQKHTKQAKGHFFYKNFGQFMCFGYTLTDRNQLVFKILHNLVLLKIIFYTG